MPVRFRPLLALAALVLALTFAAPVAAQQTPTLGAPETQTETAHRRRRRPTAATAA